MSLGLSNLALGIVNVMDKSDSVLNVMESTSCVFRFACVCVYAPAHVCCCRCAGVCAFPVNRSIAPQLLMSCQDLCAHNHVHGSYLAD